MQNALSYRNEGRAGLSVHRGGRAVEKEVGYYDYLLVCIVLFLVCFGMVMIFSTSSYEAAKKLGDATYYIKRQGLASLLGIGAMFAVSRIDYHRWAFFAVPGYILSIVLILLVKTSLGVEVKGARRWLNFGIGLNLQPAEVAKLFMIVFLATMVVSMGRKLKGWKGFLVTVGSSSPIVLMIYFITNNMSSAVIVLGIAMLMVFVASPSLQQFLVVGLAGSTLVGIVVLVARKTMDNQLAINGDFRFERIMAWLDPEAFASGKGFQTLQSLYAIGSGGVLGKGLGMSMQKLGFIPEAQNDMIFSIICEELGVFGAIAVLAMFFMLLCRFFIIATNAPDLFGAMLVVGVMGHIAIQVILNIAVVTNTMPNTGISLPFISYGGSSVLFLLVEIGLVLSVSNSIRFTRTTS